MRLENRTDSASVLQADRATVFGFTGRESQKHKKRSDGKFMKKNNITRQSHEQMDMGLDISDDTYVTVWVPRNQ